MKRFFYPVGRGGFGEEIFYTEKGKELSVIYDCGSSSRANGNSSLELRDGIYKWLDIDDSIDLVFISHYHNDHINLLESLVKKYKVKNIILPSITGEEKLYYLLDFFLKEEVDFNRDSFIFYESLFSGKLEETNIHFFHPSSSGKIGEGREIDVVDLESGNYENLTTGDEFIFSDFWSYIPYYRKVELDDPTILSKLNKHYPGIVDESRDCKIDMELFERHFHMIVENFTKLKIAGFEDEHKNRFNPHKSNLTLYSGPRKMPEFNYFEDCLYTGDYHNSQKYINSLLDFYKKKSLFKESMGLDIKHNLLLWPHHGEIDYYNEKLHKWFNEYLIYADIVGEYMEKSPCPRIRADINSRPDIHWVNERDFYQKQYYF